MILDHIIQNLPPFIEGAPVYGAGRIEWNAGLSTTRITGVGTQFKSLFIPGDLLGIWFPTTPGYDYFFKIKTIESDTELHLDDTIVSNHIVGEVPAAVSPAGGVEYCLVLNETTASILLSSASVFQEYWSLFVDDWQNKGTALRLRLMELLLFPGGWETDQQLRDYLEQVWKVHQRRGTRGFSGAELDAMTPTDLDRWAGIYGECRRLVREPRVDVNGHGGVALIDGDPIDWALDVTYPDFNAGDPPTIQPAWDVANGLAWLDIQNALIIELHLSLSDEQFLSQRRIKHIVLNELVPFHIPTLVEFIIEP